MTSIIKLKVFSGAKDEGPLCYLLQVDGDYILLDCGWDERFGLQYFEELKPFIPKVSSYIFNFLNSQHIIFLDQCSSHISSRSSPSWRTTIFSFKMWFNSSCLRDGLFNLHFSN